MFEVAFMPEIISDASGYFDFVRQVFISLGARYSSQMKHVPFSLFQYYCMIAWWHRVLFVHHSNGRVLTQNQREFFDAISALSDQLVIPVAVSQYLCRIGNFIQSDGTYRLRAPPVSFGITKDLVTRKGWFETEDIDNRVLNGDFGPYGKWPAPAVSVIAICNEANANHPASIARHTLEAIWPIVEGCQIVPPENILGWKNVDVPMSHSSWLSVYQELGWSSRGMPRDVGTEFLVSTSTLVWLCEMFSSIANLPTRRLSDSAASGLGSPIQTYSIAP